MSANPLGIGTSNHPPPRKEKRKLACHACRARRIRCEWPDNGSDGCIACGLADLRCPGEPEPRKRQRRNDGQAVATTGSGAGSPLATTGIAPLVPVPDSGGSKLDLGGALTFHLIESLFIMANPSIPGTAYHLYRELLNSAGGSSREIEIAAECLCSAFIASAATFSDHASIIGPSSSTMPVDLPSGTSEFYQPLTPYGAKRKQAVQELVKRALSLFEESKIVEFISLETVYTILAFDQMINLTTIDGDDDDDGGGDKGRFVEKASGVWKLLPRDLGERQMEKERLGLWLLILDAQSAAINKRPLTFTDFDLPTHFPYIDFHSPPLPSFDPSRLVAHEEGWTNLGIQLAPISVSLVALYRHYISLSEASLSSYEIRQIWTGINTSLGILDSVSDVIPTLPPLPELAQTQQRTFDLNSLLHSYRRTALRLDLIIRDRLLYAYLAGRNDLIDVLTESSERIKQDFVRIEEILSWATSFRSLLSVIKTLEMLECFTNWISFRSAGNTPQENLALLGELGIEGGRKETFLKALDLASWSSGTAVKQRKAIEVGNEGVFMRESVQAPPPPAQRVLPPAPVQALPKPQKQLPPPLQQTIHQSQPPVQQLHQSPPQQLHQSPPPPIHQQIQYSQPPPQQHQQIYSPPPILQQQLHHFPDSQSQQYIQQPQRARSIPPPPQQHNQWQPEPQQQPQQMHYSPPPPQQLQMYGSPGQNQESYGIPTNGGYAWVSHQQAPIYSSQPPPPPPISWSPDLTYNQWNSPPPQSYQQQPQYNYETGVVDDATFAMLNTMGSPSSAFTFTSPLPFPPPQQQEMMYGQQLQGGYMLPQPNQPQQQQWWNGS